ncbi:hypothetical protein CAMSH0001_1839 [Campylobacter showae RM3277]|uniref:Uncharacterized protein n=1 Tax=Campylobacter showae RM3277 TaxID=553219 RepID=C6RDC3_9BACT|nr:hypothetical protein CAMSH0001_1839 [Campylobacter showae RM3277]
MRDCRKFYKNVNFSKPLVCLFCKFQVQSLRQRIRKNRKFKQKGVIS